MPTAIPTIDYENYVVERAADRSVRLGVEPGSEREVNLLQATRERFCNWAQLGNLYADVLENPDTPYELDEAIRVELEDLYEAAGSTVCTTDPAILRLLYPLLRDRAWARAKGGDR